MKYKTRNWNRKTFFFVPVFLFFLTIDERGQNQCKKQGSYKYADSQILNKMVCQQFIVNVYKNMAWRD